MKINSKTNADRAFKAMNILCSSCGTEFSLDENDKLNILSSEKLCEKENHTGDFFFDVPISDLITYFDEYINNKPITTKFILPANFPKDGKIIEDLELISEQFENNKIRFVCPSYRTTRIINQFECPVCGNIEKRTVYSLPYLICLIDGFFDYDPVFDTAAFTTYTSCENDDVRIGLLYIVFKTDGVELTNEEENFFKKRNIQVLQGNKCLNNEIFEMLT